ncbi:MAG: hypothetical protein A2428_11780 [Bdellovibrionales bacterium RIFOXYC1_FULL_54_43]|nr:MAG: hypothetical protein A2428_11780 [Bdellovibrionales bacterium RIFOXYC1_FULL_54_43]OFZ81736.1 MAG: hypothetical protein A2603_09700 [Bdellovibrionales bacterium RIFOXYD1_FULL_55_31]
MPCQSILIVEDDAGISETLRLILETEGFTVFSAANGKEGLDILPTIPSPCLILLDLMMPVMDGWAFAEAIDKNAVLATIPIVVVTAFSEKATTLKKANAVIKKPFDIDALMNLVRQYCGRM